jgi:undecaprenyl-diphosphatase
VRGTRLDPSLFVAVAVGSWATFLVTAVLIGFDPPTHIDHVVQDHVASTMSSVNHDAPVARSLSALVGRVGWTPVEAAVVVLVALAVFLRGRSLRPLVVPVCAYLAVAVCVGTLKEAYHRHEPFFWLGRSGRSFPSGHSATAMAVYGGLALAIVLAGDGAGRWVRPGRRRTVVFAGLTVAVVLVMIAMLVRSAHWISDIVGGAALGAAWLATVAALAIHVGWLPPPGEPGQGEPGQQDDRDLGQGAVAGLADRDRH